MNVLVIALSPGTVAAALAAWDAHLGSGDHGFVLTLGGDVGIHGRFSIHPLEWDLTRARRRRRLLVEATARWPSTVNPSWRWLLAQRWSDLVWNIRAFDPDLVDLRWTPLPKSLAVRLASELSPIHVLREGEPPGPTASPWRRYDPGLLVSIVLPVYRGAHYLPEALDSCLAQTHGNLQIVVVNDASPDETPEVLARYARQDDRIVAVHNPKNLRLPGALNVGFARTSGELLTWTSHDNVYAPRAIETLVRYLCTWPDIDFVYSAYRPIDENGIPGAGVIHASPPWNAAFWNPFGPYFLYRRRVYESTGEFRPDMEYLEDYEYWVRVSKRFRMMRLPWPLYDYRKHLDSMTGRAPDLVGLRRRLQQEHFGRR